MSELQALPSSENNPPRRIIARALGLLLRVAMANGAASGTAADGDVLAYFRTGKRYDQAPPAAPVAPEQAGLSLIEQTDPVSAEVQAMAQWLETVSAGDFKP